MLFKLNNIVGYFCFLSLYWYIFDMTIFDTLSLSKIIAMLQMTFLKCIVMNDKYCILIRMFVHKGRGDSISVLVEIIAWH